jgi:hypothetical protein
MDIIMDEKLTESHENGFGIHPKDEAGFSLDKISTISHNYNQHPLMQMDSLKELAKRLIITDQCRFIEPDTKIDSPFNHKGKERDDFNIETVFQNIENSGSWIALYNIQTDPEYKQFLWEVVEKAKNLVAHQEKVFDVCGFIFISAPPSVTPFHIDRENNFWLQIHGRKKLSLWDREDRATVPATAVENFIMSGSLKDVVLKEDMMSRRFDFDCSPGDGVYFPSTTPHMTRTETSWVREGDGVSVSIGIVFYTNVTRKTAYVYSLNSMLRKYFNWQPRSPRKSYWVDTLKYPFARIAVGLRRRFRGYKPPPGF